MRSTKHACFTRLAVLAILDNVLSGQATTIVGSGSFIALDFAKEVDRGSPQVLSILEGAVHWMRHRGPELATRRTP